MSDTAICAKCIRVLVVDDHAILRDGIRSLLERHEDLTVVGEAGNGVEALALVEALRPDIVLMDLAMPEMDGLEATRRLRESHPAVKVLILTQHANQEYIAPALQAGAAGYVLKRSGGREVVAAIRDVFEQGAFLEPGVAREVLRDYAAPQGRDAEPRLTDREREVLGLAVVGKSNKEIAQALFISPKTASVHRTNIMAKLGVRNSAELVRYVMEHRLLLDERRKMKDR
ncbi:MAG: response regulator transcription factor [Chloroflexi bacterium]|nr:response regulator transcription factor [Chloroflexota bacterium]